MPAVILFKGIRKSKWSEHGLQVRLLGQMNKFVKVLKKDYAQTTQGWKTDVKFTAQEGFKPDGPTVMVGTDSKIYKYVDEGTKRHVIMAGAFTGKSKKRFLVFRENYRPATIPNVLYSFPALSYGKLLRARIVLHPGTKARNFTKMIQKKEIQPYKEAMQKVLNEWAKEDQRENQ